MLQAVAAGDAHLLVQRSHPHPSLHPVHPFRLKNVAIDFPGLMLPGIASLLAPRVLALLDPRGVSRLESVDDLAVAASEDLGASESRPGGFPGKIENTRRRISRNNSNLSLCQSKSSMSPQEIQ